MKVYFLTFSINRLVKVLRDAGFTVEPPELPKGSVLRFRSSPGEDEICIEAWRPTVPRWEPLEDLPDLKRDVETVEAPGQYL